MKDMFEPEFNVIVPLCSVCLNKSDGDNCKAKGKVDKECQLAKSYKCDSFKENAEDKLLYLIKDIIK